MTLTLVERYAGVMVGVLAGDALGAAYENKEPSYITADFARRGGLTPFDYDDPWGVRGRVLAGSPTDDSELTAALAQSLIECNESDPHHQYRYFKRAVNGSQTFVGYGVSGSFGRTTRLMLKAANYEGALRRENRPNIPSNGSLMRAAPLALWYHQRGPRKLKKATRESSQVTHTHIQAIECSVLYVHMLDRILRGETPLAAWSYACMRGMGSSLFRLSILESSLETPEATNKWLHQGGKSGSAEHTLHVALWSSIKSRDFRSGIELAVRFGGDTDTAAAVAGGLLGAYYGIDGIPTEWQNVLKGREQMVSLADQLLRI